MPPPRVSPWTTSLPAPTGLRASGLPSDPFPSQQLEGRVHSCFHSFLGSRLRQVERSPAEQGFRASVVWLRPLFLYPRLLLLLSSVTSWKLHRLGLVSPTAGPAWTPAPLTPPFLPHPSPPQLFLHSPPQAQASCNCSLSRPSLSLSLRGWGKSCSRSQSRSGTGPGQESRSSLFPAPPGRWPWRKEA